MNEVSPMNVAISKYEADISLLMADIPKLPYPTNSDDPIYEVTAMVEKLQSSISQVESLKDRIVDAVAKSLGLAKKELETEMKLVNTPLIESILNQKATFAAFGQQLDSVEKRIDRGISPQSFSPQRWQLGLILGLIGIQILALGGIIYLCKDALLLQTPNGQIAKRIVELNPDLSKLCNHPLSKQQRQKLAKGDIARGFCTVLN